jgi:hypothetical protein
MKTETTKVISSKFFETYAQVSMIWLSSIECRKIGNKAAEVFVPLLREAVPVTSPGQIKFDG